MIDLYAMGSPNVVKIFIALEELGLPYEIHPTDVFGEAGVQFAAEFQKLNPNGKVPVIVDREGPHGAPYTVFESGAILLYLADKTGRLLPTETAARYEVIQWLMVQLTGVGPMFGQYVHFRNFAPPGNDYGVVRYTTQVKRLYRTLEARLAEMPYLGGAGYSIADIATYPWMINAFAGVDGILAATKRDHPHLLRWAAEIGQRPAVIRAVAASDAVRASVTPALKASPAALDRVFGRGAFAEV